MKNRILKFLKTYWWCFLLGILLVAGLRIVDFFCGETVVSDGFLKFTVTDCYLMYVMPLFSVFYGIITCVFLKKVWMPNLILFVTVWIAMPSFYLDFSFKTIFTLPAFAWPSIVFVFAVVFSAIIKLYQRAFKSRP